MVKRMQTNKTIKGLQIRLQSTRAQSNEGNEGMNWAGTFLEPLRGTQGTWRGQNRHQKKNRTLRKYGISTVEESHQEHTQNLLWD